MDSKAAITRQPCYYTHHHSVRGCGHHASPLAVPWSALAGKTTGNRYDYTGGAHQGCFGCSPITCASGYSLHRCCSMLPGLSSKSYVPSPTASQQEANPMAHPRSTPAPSPSSTASLAPCSLAEPLAGDSPCQPGAGS